MVMKSIRALFNNLKNRDHRGYIAIIAAFLFPVVILLIYLKMTSGRMAQNRLVVDYATQRAAVAAAEHFMEKCYSDAFATGFANQKDYVERKAIAAFNSAMKTVVGVKNNVIPVKDEQMGFLEVRWSYFNQVKNSEQSRFWESVLKRYEDFISNNHFFFSGAVEPDADELLEIKHYSGDSRGLAFIKANSGCTYFITLFEKDTDTSTPNSINVTAIDADTVQVQTDVSLLSHGNKSKTYRSTYKAKAPRLNADIVIGIPTSRAACTVDNEHSSEPMSLARDHTVVPICQITRALRDFVKNTLAYRNCAIGIIPYSGKVSLPGQVSTVSHGQYKYSQYAAVSPTIPIAESYKFTLSGDIGASLNGTLAKPTRITGLMYRTDMLNSGSNVLMSPVNGSTKFYAYPSYIAYGGDANILAGYAKRRTVNFPNPNPMLCLSDNKMHMYRYLALIDMYADYKNKSNFLYLPIIFGMSMLDGFSAGTQERRTYNSASAATRKKIAIIIATRADEFMSHELTYFGFVNDAAHIPMTDGDRLDYEKGDLEQKSDGFYHNKQFEACDSSANGSYCSTASYIKNYYKNTEISCNYNGTGKSGTYTLKTPQPANLKIVTKSLPLAPYATVYVTNSHSSVRVTGVTASSDVGLVKRSESGDCYYCYLLSGKQNATFTITFSNDTPRTTPVLARVKLAKCEFNSAPANYALRQDSESVYICSESTTYDADGVINITLKQTDTVTQWDSLSYGDGLNLLSSSTKYIYPSTTCTRYYIKETYNAKVNLFGEGKRTGKSPTVNAPLGSTTAKTLYARRDLQNITSYHTTKFTRYASYKDLANADSTWCRISKIFATYGGDNTATRINSVPNSYVPYAKIYKKNIHTNVTITGVSISSAANGKAAVAEYSDHYRVYIPTANYDVSVTISYRDNNEEGIVSDPSFSGGATPEACRTVLAQIETFGCDASTNDGNLSVHYRQDNNYLYCCYKNSTGPFTISFRQSSSYRANWILSFFGNHLFGDTSEEYYFLNNAGHYTDPQGYIARGSNVNVYMKVHGSAGGSYDMGTHSMAASAANKWQLYLTSQNAAYTFTFTVADLINNREVYNSGSTIRRVYQRIGTIRATQLSINGYQRRTYRSTQASQIPYAVIYEYPGLYSSGTAYKTVTNVEYSSGCGWVEYDSSIQGWKCYVPDSSNTLKVKVTYDSAYNTRPILARIEYFGTRHHTHPSISHFRDDPSYYYICYNSTTDSDTFEVKQDSWMPNNWDVSYIDDWLLGAQSGISRGLGNKYENALSTSTTSKTVHACNCNIYFEVYSYSSFSSQTLYITNKTDKTVAYATYDDWQINDAEGYGYGNHYCSFNGYYGKENSSICWIRYIYCCRYQSFTRTMGEIDPDSETVANYSEVSNCKIVFSGAHSKTYNLSGGFSVIYIPRANISTGNIYFELFQAQIVSIEWSNGLNGTAGVYACGDSSGNNVSNVYYASPKRSKHARWINFFRQAPSDSTQPFGHSSIKSFCAAETHSYGWFSNAFYIRNDLAPRSRQYVVLQTLSSHGDVTLMADNVNRLPYSNVWFARTSGYNLVEHNYMRGIERYFYADHENFFDVGVQTYADAVFLCFTTEKNTDRIRLRSAEFTSDVNRVLEKYYGQTTSGQDNSGDITLSDTATNILRTKVTPDAVAAFNNHFGANGRIYLIKYRLPASEEKYFTSLAVHKQYNANDQESLTKTLNQIMEDIKEYSGFEEAKVVD